MNGEHRFDPKKVYLRPQEVLERWGGAISIKTLANWRSGRKGPPYVRFGGKILYPIAELVAWERSQMPFTLIDSQE